MDENGNRPHFVFASYLGVVTTGHPHDKVDEDGVVVDSETDSKTENEI